MHNTYYIHPCYCHIHITTTLPNPYSHIVKELLQLLLQSGSVNTEVCLATQRAPPKNQRAWRPAKCPQSFLSSSPTPPLPLPLSLFFSWCVAPSALLFGTSYFGPCCATQSCCSMSRACISLVPLRTHTLLRIVVCYEHTGQAETCAQ